MSLALVTEYQPQCKVLHQKGPCRNTLFCDLKRWRRALDTGAFDILDSGTLSAAALAFLASEGCSIFLKCMSAS